MRVFEFKVHDVRFAETVGVFAITSDENRAWALAKRLLQESHHYRSIDVFEQRRLLFRIDREDLAKYAA